MKKFVFTAYSTGINQTYAENGDTDTTTLLAGGSQPHTHSLSGASGEASSLPPYYALSYIMRTA